MTASQYSTRLDRAAAAGSETDRAGSVDIQRIVGELNTLAHVFTRTKKREVSEYFPTRRAAKLEVEFTHLEQRFYDAVSRWAKFLYRETHSTPALCNSSV